jgi:hypothetical protein
MTLDPNLLFTKDMIAKVRKLRHLADGQRIDVIERDVIAPEMANIDKITGQENHPRYMAYLIDHLVASGKL